MIDMAVLAERVLGGGIAASVLWGAGVNGVFFFTSLFLQRAEGFSATSTGLVFLPVAAFIVLVTPFTPALAGRIGAARTVAAGLILVAEGLALLALRARPSLSALPAIPAPLAQGGYHLTLLDLLPGVAVIGIGSALTVPLTSCVLTAVPPSHTGVAGGVLSLAREASGLVGISVIGLIVTAGHPVSPGGAVKETFTRGYGTGLLAAAALVTIGAVVARLTLPGTGRPR